MACSPALDDATTDSSAASASARVSAEHDAKQIETATDVMVANHLYGDFFMV
jgi:hypothetical protein